MKNNNQRSDQEGKEDSFEKSFSRLEQILDKMHSDEISLDESLKLYEEADKLINSCGKRLNEAERKIQILIKNRNGELVKDQDGMPQVEDFDKGNE